MHFLPGINLLTLRCMVAKFPVDHLKYRKSTKPRNIEPWWELNQFTACTEIRTTWSSIKQSVPVYYLFGFACFLLISFYSNHLATSYSICSCARVWLTETGSKDKHCSRNKWQNINFRKRQEKFHSCSCCVLCVTESPALENLPPSSC